MPSNVEAGSGSGGPTFLSKQVSHDGDTVQMPGTHILGVTGTEDSYTIAAINGSAANGLEVDVTQVQGSVAVTNADLTTIAAAVATEGSALGSGVLLQGDDGTDRTNVLVDTTGHLQVDVLTAPSTAVTNAGTFAVQVDGAALTALQLIDDAIYTDGAGTPSKGALVMGTDGTNPQAIAVDASGNVQVDLVTAAVTNAGTFAVQVDGDALTSLQLIDDAVAAEGAALGKGVLLQGDDGTDRTNVLVDAAGHLQVDVLTAPSTATTPGNTVSTNNSTTSTLAGDAIYTGTGEDVSGHTAVTITIEASHDSATDGMTFRFSSDNTNWDDVYTFTYTAADGARRFQFPVTAQYFQVRYTNGSTLQTHFRVQTILHANNVLTSIHRLVDNTDPDRSAQVVKAALIAQASGSGDFVPVAANASGKLQVATEVDQLAAAAALSDDFANPTTTQVGACAMVWDGSTWDRAPGTSADGVTVNLGSNNDVTVTSGTVTANAGTNLNTSALALETGGNLATVAGAVSGTEMQVDIVAALPTGTNSIGKLAANSGVDIGDVDVLSVAAGTNLIGDVGISGARTSGGTTPYRNIDLDEDAADTVKGSEGQVYWIHCMNLSSGLRYLLFYDESGAITVGTTVPKLTFPIATQGDTNGAGFTLSIPNGIAFANSIKVAATNNISTAGTALGANEVVLALGYG